MDINLLLIKIVLYDCGYVVWKFCFSNVYVICNVKYNVMLFKGNIVEIVCICFLELLSEIKICLK